MKYTNDQIRATLKEFIIETGQNDIVAVISFCVGYYGYITKQIWNVITDMKRDQLIVLYPQDPRNA